jgi:hypothetical protein
VSLIEGGVVHDRRGFIGVPGRTVVPATQQAVLPHV